MLSMGLKRRIGGLEGVALARVLVGIMLSSHVLLALRQDRVPEWLGVCYKDLKDQCGLWDKSFDRIQNIVVGHGQMSDLEDKQFEQACTAWKLSPQQLQAFFKASETYEVSPFEDYDDLPCHLEGSFMLGGQKYTFEINAGGGFEIHDRRGKRYYFGCNPLLYGAASAIDMIDPKCAQFLPYLGQFAPYL
ncbi:hypothetical protein NHP20013_10730 [Helicobacter bizzozeronii]|nr:hypothetical protein NHP20013_10730 [Helicobacter bizzozeronii]